MKRIKNMKRFLICLFSFLFIGCSIAGGAVLLSNSSYSDNTGGEKAPSENELTKNAPTNSDLWTASGNYATAFDNEGEAGIDGSTEEKAYEIRTAEQLALLAYRINTSSTNSTYKSLYYVQTADIDLSLHYWDAFGTSSYYFSGAYDGGNFTISGLYTQAGSSSTYSYQGLFGYVRGQSSSTKATIKNVGIIDSNIHGYSNVGGVVGYAGSYVAINNSYNTGDVTGSGGSVGGVVGSANSSVTITNCYNTGNIIGGDNFVGGVAGSAGETVTNCYNEGVVCSAGSIAGGVVGGSSTITLTDCYNAGLVMSESISEFDEVSGFAGSPDAGMPIPGFGGILGWTCENSVITNCYNTGNIIVDSNCPVGGILGEAHTGSVADSNTTISNCYNTGNITGRSTAGGIAGSVSTSTVTDCYNIGNVTGNNYVGGIAGNSDIVTNCYNTGAVTGSGDYVGGVVGYSDYSDITNCYYGGNCTLSYGIGSSSSNTGASKDENLIANAKSLSWYQDSSKWDSEYPWDFVEVWSLVSSANDGYPILQGFSVIITYNSNFGENETITEQVPSGQEIVIAGYDLFTRVGYEISHWNTKPDGTGLNFYAGDTYSEGAGLTLYAIWEAGIYSITLDANGGSGGTQEIWVKYGYGFYANSLATGNSITSLTSLPTREGYTFNGFYTSATSGSRIIDSTGKIVVSNTFTTADVILYAQWVANNTAKYDSEGGYWYIENGKMPQKKVTDSTLISNINSSSTTGTTYYFAGLSLQSRVYGGKEYCQYNGNWYEVMPIRWRLVYSSSQTSGYGTTTDTLAVMDEIVYVDAFSDSYIGAGVGYSSESVTEFMKNQIDATYLVTETKSMPTFGSTSLNGTPASVSSNIFVASYDDLSNFTTNKNGTEKLGKIKFSDLAKDYLRANGKDTLYFTRDLGKTYNHIYCMNANGDRVQYKAQNYFGVQFAVKISEYACIE